MRGEATPEYRSVVSSAGQLDRGLRQLEPAATGRAQRQRDRQAGQDGCAEPDECGSVERRGGFFEQVDLALVEQPHLEPGDVDAEPERGARKQLGRLLLARERGALFERPTCRRRVTDEQPRPAQPEQRLGADVVIEGRGAERGERAFEVCRCLLPREGADRALARADRPPRGLGGPSARRREQVVGDDGRLRVAGRQHGGDALVQRPALLVAQRLERRFAEQVVDERPRDDARGALDHPRRRGAVERAGDVGDGELEHRAQLRRCERAPEHRRGDENRPVTGRERREAAGEQVARTGREPAARQRGRIGSEQAPELDDQERVATGAPLDLLRGAFRALPAQRPAQQCRDPAPVEAVQRHTVGRRAQPCERRTREHLRVAVRGDDEDGKGRELSGHRREQTDGALVGPVQVVEHDDVCTLGGRAPRVPR